jgi:hypothetical protein
MSCRRLVFDTGPLCSFAVVSRLDLLEAICAGHGSWPLSVQRELRAGATTLPALARAHADAWKLHRAMVAAGRRPGRLDPGLLGR